jgi:protein TonB
MDVSLSGNMVLICLVALIALILGVIYVLRNVFGGKTVDYFKEKYGSETQTSLATRTKYPEANVFEHSGTIFRFGLVGALALTVMAFAWTQYEKTIDVSMYNLEVEDELEIEPPRTAEPPPPPPPPPPPVIEEVPEEEILEEEEPVFEDQSIEEETVMEDLPPPVEEKKAPPPPPPPPPPPEPEVDEIFKVVEEMPRFPGCNAGTMAEKKACADEKLLQYLYKNLKYPAIARENGVEGRVYIQFVVEKDGTIQDAKIVRDIGAGCGQAALSVVTDMNSLPERWTPGKQRGKSVRVLYTLPVTFKLEG